MSRVEWVSTNSTQSHQQYRNLALTDFTHTTNQRDMEPTTLQKAIAVANKASQEDQDGNYEEAVKSYQHAVKYFLHIVKREPQGKEGNQKIRDKCKQYLDRAEELQDYLDKKEEKGLTIFSELLHTNAFLFENAFPSG